MAVLLPLTLLSGCPPHPSYNPFVLDAIRAESRVLIATYPTTAIARVPDDRLPPVIASLKPESVTVHRWGVDIMTKPFFDGGWGYQVPRRDKRDLPMLPDCYSEPSPGVFWHEPC